MWAKGILLSAGERRTRTGSRDASVPRPSGLRRAARRRPGPRSGPVAVHVNEIRVNSPSLYLVTGRHRSS
eukprot:1105719-Prymnesium_polylepis.1